MLYDNLSLEQLKDLLEVTDNAIGRHPEKACQSWIDTRSELLEAISKKIKKEILDNEK